MMSGAGPATRKRARQQQSGNAAAAAALDARATPSGDTAALDGVMVQLQADFQCAICHGLVVAPHLLLCSHRFCGACIFAWTSRNDTCPTCRADLQGPPALERGVVRQPAALSLRLP